MSEHVHGLHLQGDSGGRADLGYKVQVREHHRVQLRLPGPHGALGLAQRGEQEEEDRGLRGEDRGIDLYQELI